MSNACYIFILFTQEEGNKCFGGSIQTLHSLLIHLYIASYFPRKLYETRLNTAMFIVTG